MVGEKDNSIDEKCMGLVAAMPTKETGNEKKDEIVRKEEERKKEARVVVVVVVSGACNV